MYKRLALIKVYGQVKRADDKFADAHALKSTKETNISEPLFLSRGE